MTMSAAASLWERTVALNEEKFDEVVGNILSAIPKRGDYYQWAKRSNRYVEREVIRRIISPKRSSERKIVVVDVRDDDHKGGNIRGSLHLADEEFSPSSIRKLIKYVDKIGASMIVFHCMESARRGPRCARRFVEILSAYDVDDISIKVLIGGFDQWVRAYFREEPELIENFDDDYWGFCDAERVCRVKERGPSRELADKNATVAAGHHKLYTRPVDQKATPWSDAGSNVSKEGDCEGR
eukprot:g4032.t1